MVGDFSLFPSVLQCNATLGLFSTAYKYGGAGEGEEDSSGSDIEPSTATAALGDESKHPRGLVEAWLEDAFVGYLREDAVLFVWDHLFLLG